ncbi:chemotaxis protein CheW [Anaerovorax odorimutans]|uniref:Chemotaxis protein CheW n=1 Tax=Anaerovorax odorimutans TaxID=109327 RepID=A0ABT1RP26_9FIRM|nr:chemotaxis protein CheW [Anaerovorax odorimutans]MCQ4636942.1 chemotaxis protein CheW [Anaerovorax odorimutans]
MGTLDDLYITITSDELLFFVPVFYIKTVERKDSREEDIPFVDLAKLTGADEERKNSGYRLLLSHEGRTFALTAEQVGNLRTVPREAQRPLPDSVRTDENRYLSAIVPIESEDESGRELLAYVLDPKILYESAAAARPDLEEPKGNS